MGRGPQGFVSAAATEAAGFRHPGRVLLLICAWLAAAAWLRPLMLPDEGRYAGVALEMLNSGDWLTPTFNGLPFFHKPPLFYWITAAGLSVLGVNEFAARSASLLGGVAMAFSMALFARRWMSECSARTGLLVLLTQPLVFLASQFANLDMLVAGCIASTVFLLAHVLLCADAGQPPGVALPAAYVAAALGVLAKGLIGLVLPALVVGAWMLATRRWRRLPSLWSWTGALAFMAIALPWFVAAQLRHDGFAHYFFVVQHFQRFTGTTFNNAQAWWFYPAVLVLLGLPWTPWLLRLWRPGRDAAGQDVRVLLWLWLALVVLFFSLPQSKLVGYVLPALPALSLLIAEVAPPPRSAGWWGSVVVAVVLCLGSVLYLSYYPPKTWRPLAQALHEQRAEGEPVLYAGDYFYDVAFYVRLRTPPVVVAAWDDPDIAQNDDWRKVLVDGAAFAPASASALLLTPQQVLPLLCRHAVAWALVTDAAAPQQAWLANGRIVQRGRGAALWRIESTAATRGAACVGEAAHG